MHTFSKKQKPNQQSKLVNTSKHGRAVFGQSQAVRSILHLQRKTGNHAFPRFLQSNTGELEVCSSATASARFAHEFSQMPVHLKTHAKLQPKLVVSTSEDNYEREANLVAEHVMRKSEPQLQHAYAYHRGCQKCTVEQDNREQLQIKHVGLGSGVLTEVPSIVHEALTARGQPLDSETRGFMESRFSHDFTRVRIHDDARAAEAANAINAEAFTLGHHIAFGTCHYAPHTVAGRTLLAHELTHVVQRSGILSRHPKRSVPASLLDMRKPKPWDQLPSAVRRVFHESFMMRLGTEWIWNKQTAEQSYNSWPTRHRNAFDQIYTELIATDLWREVKHITEVFVGAGGSVPGVRFKPMNEVVLGALLRGKSFCRDTLIYHAARRIFHAVLRAVSKPKPKPSGNAKWRQMKTGGTKGLHVIPGIETEVHIDSISPVAGRNKNGDCNYSARHILPHVSRDLKSWSSFMIGPLSRSTSDERQWPSSKMLQPYPWLQWRFPMQKQGLTQSKTGPRLSEIRRRIILDASRKLLRFAKRHRLDVLLWPKRIVTPIELERRRRLLRKFRRSMREYLIRKYQMSDK